MAINKKLIHFKTFENFNSQKLSANEENTKYTLGIDGEVLNGTPDILYQSIVWIKDAQKQWTHGQLYDGKDFSVLVEITYEELKTLRDNSQLVPGQQYRIIDYVTTTIQENTQSAGHQFDVIVTADDESTLNEIARAIQHDGDTYFAENDLNAWQIWYCIDNDTNRFTWADAINGKGIIYRMIDEWNNDCPYDFKNIQFKHPNNPDDTNWYYTFDVSSTDATVSNNVSCLLNAIKPYFVNDKVQQLNNNIFMVSVSCIGNVFQNNCYSNSFGVNCSYNSFGANCYSNSFGVNCQNNSFENGCYSNNLGRISNGNSFGVNCYSNSFGANCQNNSFENGCYSNNFGDDCNGNSFGDDCQDNSFENGCSSNSFGDDCQNNSFGNNCTNNSFENGCYSNSFGNGCCYNSFGIYCQGNSFGINGIGNTFGEYNMANTFGPGCDNNTFGNRCYHNSFGNACSYNSFRLNASETATLLDYCYYNHFDDSCSYNIIWNSVQPTYSNKLQNINVIRGVFGKSTAYNFINIVDKNITYEVKVAKNSSGVIKVYCEADLIA